jgi:ATP-dependent DNA ligase
MASGWCVIVLASRILVIPMSASRELHCQLNRVEPCLPRSARKPPAGAGFRIIAVRDGARVRLLTRKGIDLARRFAQIAAAVAVLPVRSCIIDGEAIACDANGLAVFELLRQRAREPISPCSRVGEPRVAHYRADCASD